MSPMEKLEFVRLVRIAGQCALELLGDEYCVFCEREMPPGERHEFECPLVDISSAKARRLSP